MSIKTKVEQASRFVIKSYTPVYMGIIAFLTLSILVSAAISANSEVSTIRQRISLKEQEIVMAERIAEEKYQRELETYTPCPKPYDRPCYRPFPKRAYPMGLNFELAELQKIADKSWSDLFLEKIFTDKHSAFSPFGLLLIFIILIPTLKGLYLLARKIPEMIRLMIGQVNRIKGNFQRMSNFQKYLLIVVSLGVMVYLLK